MPVTITPTQSDAQAVLRSFLLLLAPSGAEVILGQANRVPEPQGSQYVVMTPIRFQRGDTNLVGFDDVKLTGSIAGSVLTATAVTHGQIKAGRTLFGVGVAATTLITGQLSGTPGGAGTYSLSNSQTLASETLAAGALKLTQNAWITVQLDFHSADTSAGDMAQAFSTAFRDDYGVTFFRGINGAIFPISADNPKQMPFTNAEGQYEWRWVAEAEMQINQTIEVPQQFADAVNIGLIEVDSHYPP